MGSGTSTRCAPAILFEFLEIERFMLRVLSETPEHGMTCVADRYFTHEEIRQKVDESRQAERGHRQNRLAFCKKIQAGRNAYGDNGDPGIPIEILLNV